MVWVTSKSEIVPSNQKFCTRFSLAKKEKKTIIYALWGLLTLTALDPALFIVRNTHYPYIYFNPIGGGLGGAFGNYETDYWGVGIRQALGREIPWIRRW